MQQPQLHFPGMIWNGYREETGILVGHVAKVDALKPSEIDQPKPLPMEEIARLGHGNSWPLGREGSVCHQIALQWLHEGYARILTATASVGQKLIVGLWLKGNTQSLNANGGARLIEAHLGNSNARVVAPSHQSRKEKKAAVRAAHSCWIQNTFCLVRVTGLGFHHQAQALHLIVAHWSLPKQAIIAEITLPLGATLRSSA
jgi:hypothetical protein